MSDQIIITISRESGSAGHTIAGILAKKLNIRLLDKELVEETVAYAGYSREHMRKYDEKPVNYFTSRRIGAYTNSPEANVAEKVFEYIKSQADQGESFVLVGRCGHCVLKDNPNTVNVFIHGEYETKVSHLMEYHNLSREKAVKFMKNTDRKRKAYHNHYCDNKWADGRAFDLCINSSRVGLDGASEIVLKYLDEVNKLKQK